MSNNGRQRFPTNMSILSLTNSTASPASHSAQGALSSADQWNQWIDQRLREWAQLSNDSPAHDEDDGLEMPRRAAIENALAVARWFLKRGYPAASDVVANGDGGIFFHWGNPGKTFLTFEFLANGGGLYTASKGLRCVDSRRFTPQQLQCVGN